MSAFLGVQTAIAAARVEMERVGIRVEGVGICIELPPPIWQAFLASAEMRYVNIGASAYEGNSVTLMGATVRVK